MKILSICCTALVALVGCAEAKKQAECKSLVETINPHTTKVRKLSESLTADTSITAVGAAFGTMATEVEAGGADVKKLSIETPELKKFADDYQKMCADSAKAFKGMVAVSQKVDAAQKAATANPEAAQADAAKAQADVAASTEAIKKATSPEDAIMDGINKACGAK